MLAAEDEFTLDRVLAARLRALVDDQCCAAHRAIARPLARGRAAQPVAAGWPEPPAPFPPHDLPPPQRRRRHDGEGQAGEQRDQDRRSRGASTARRGRPEGPLLPDDARRAADDRAQLLLAAQAELGHEDPALADVELLDGRPALAPLSLNAQLAGLGGLAPGAERPLVDPLGDEGESEGGQGGLRAAIEEVQPRLEPVAGDREERRVPDL